MRESCSPISGRLSRHVYHSSFLFLPTVRAADPASEGMNRGPNWETLLFLVGTRGHSQLTSQRGYSFGFVGRGADSLAEGEDRFPGAPADPSRLLIATLKK